MIERLLNECGYLQAIFLFLFGTFVTALLALSATVCFFWRALLALLLPTALRTFTTAICFFRRAVLDLPLRATLWTFSTAVLRLPAGGLFWPSFLRLLHGGLFSTATTYRRADFQFRFFYILRTPRCFSLRGWADFSSTTSYFDNFHVKRDYASGDVRYLISMSIGFKDYC